MGPIEIETKLKVDDHGPVRERLRSLGAEYAGRVLERNHLYDRPDGSLQADGAALRIRFISVLDGVGGPSTMTFKGPAQAAKLKRRTEYEIEISDAEAARRLAEAIGFVETLCFEKIRETWQFGQCRVELDTLPRLGSFVEIEGQEEGAILAVKESLGLQDCPHIPASYMALLCGTQDQTPQAPDRPSAQATAGRFEFD